MIQIDVSIMGQTYKLACKEGEEAALREAVAYLDEKMCAIRDAGKIKGNDRIAVMAALGIAAELLATKSPEGPLVRHDVWPKSSKKLPRCMPCWMKRSRRRKICFNFVQTV